MMKLKKALVTLTVAGSMLSTQAYAASQQDMVSLNNARPAVSFTRSDMSFMFEQSSQQMQVAVLSAHEMKTTEGAVLWFAPVTLSLARIGLPYMMRIAHHTAHHAFGRLGRLPHLQANIWRPGVSGSGKVFRLPLPDRPFFRP
ncbi:MAG: hypothetical protein Q4B17_09555 [Lautropia sp.]|nr:hypothetical protein [Lautropia sp.]